METQDDSLDISQLKAMALGLDVEFDASIPAPTPQANNISNPSDNRVQENAKALDVVSSEIPCKPGLLLRDTGRQRVSVSQPGRPIRPGLPKVKLMSLGTQMEGDTQPFSPSVYEEFVKTTKAGLQDNSIATPDIYGAEHSGHIDLVGLFDRAQPEADEDADIIDGVDDIAGASQFEVHAELYPEAARFKQPKTPATNGKKRNSNGDCVNHDSVTPRLPVNPFAIHTSNDVGVMNLSQVFRATQAPSSPFTNVIPSDGTSDRPSPNMHNIHRPSTAQPLSSPAKMQRSGLQRSITEPQAKYVSMQQSQAERERRLRMHPTSSPADLRTQMHELSQDEFESEGSELRRRNNQKRIEMETHDQFGGITARPRPGSNGNVRRHGDVQAERHDTRSSPTRGRNARPTMVISDDVLADELNEDATEDETEHEEDPGSPEAEEPDELGEDNKENISSRSLQILMASPRSARKIRASATLLSSPLRQKRRMTPSHEEIDELADNAPVKAGIFSSPARVKQGTSGTQAVTIADSQTSQPGRTRSGGSGGVKAPNTGPDSSTESRNFVPQSQITALPRTSQIDSSIARKIVDGSSYIRGPGRVSSQPMSSPELRRISSPPRQHSSQQRDLQSARSGSKARRTSPGRVGSSPPPLPNRLSDDAEEDQNTRFTDHAQAEPAIDNTNLILGNEAYDDMLMSSVAKIAADTEPEAADLGAVIETPHQNISLNSTIPETRSAARYTRIKGPSLLSTHTEKLNSATTHSDSTELPAATSRQLRSNASTTFHTANTHLKDSPSKSPAGHVRPSSEPCTSPSKLKAARPKGFLDIAADPSPPDEIGEVDLDIGLMTNDDINFKDIMEGSSPIGPARKRRRGRGGRPLPVVDISSDPAPAVPASSSMERPTQLLEEMVEARAEVSSPPVSSNIEKQPSEDEETGRPESSTRSRLRDANTCVTVDSALRVSGNKATKVIHKLQLAKAKPDLQPLTSSKDRASVSAKRNQVQESSTVLRSSRENITPDRRTEQLITAPNRVFAIFMGTPAGHYPATCIGTTGGDEPRFRVRFDDGSVSIVNGSCVKRLELREGDHVKIDQPGNRKWTYVVCGLKDKELHPSRLPKDSPDRAQLQKGGSLTKYPQTDIYGHVNVLVSLKPHLATPEGSIPNPEETVPISAIYLSSTMLKNFKDRQYSYHSSVPIPTSGLQTPSERPSTPSTPSSRTRRTKASVKSITSVSLPTSVVRNGSSLFENMVFSITNVDDQDKREQIIQHIASNGGLFLESGFDELFQIPDVTSDPTSLQEDSDIENSLQLKPSALHRGFPCLIADKDCRNQKFFQALALGIPCLATRWVRDCITRQRVLPWEPYLLPSGISTFLQAVRSRLLPSCSPETVLLPEVIQNRPNFLAGSSVLLVMGKGKEHMMKAYPFIAYALGARKVARAVSFETARLMLRDGEAEGRVWDWVCFHEKETQMTVKQAEKVLFGSGNVGKRKRGLGEVVRRTRVVVTEFVIQSLILGQLVDEE